MSRVFCETWEIEIRESRSHSIHRLSGRMQQRSLVPKCERMVTTLPAAAPRTTLVKSPKAMRREGSFVNLADYLRRQFAYDEWANREVLAAIRNAGATNHTSENQRSLQLMSHILAAELVWLERMKQQPQSVPVWPEPDLAQCEAQAAKMGGLWLEFLGLITAGDVSQSISYKNSKGEPWTSTIVDR